MTEFVIATHNARKLAEITGLLAAYGHTAVGFAGTLPDEGLNSLAENARAKALAVHAAVPSATVLADDSGLFLAAQPELLGVHTARDLPREHTNAALLKLVGADRRVRLQSVLVLVEPSGTIHEAQGALSAQLAESERGTHSRGFDKLLIPDGAGMTLAEMSEAARLPYLPRQQALSQLLM